MISSKAPCKVQSLHQSQETVSLFQGLALRLCSQRQNKINLGGMGVNQKAVCSPDPFVVPSHCWSTSDLPDG